MGTQREPKSTPNPLKQRPWAIFGSFGAILGPLWAIWLVSGTLRTSFWLHFGFFRCHFGPVGINPLDWKMLNSTQMPMLIPLGLNSTPVESTPGGVDSTGVEFNPRGINPCRG